MERRGESDDDRRKIERFTNPAMRSHLLQIRTSLRILIVLGLGLAIYVLFQGIYQGSPEDLTSSLLVMVVFLSSVVIFFRYHNSISFYLTNESGSNLDRTMESQSVAWLSIAFMAAIGTLVYFLF